MKRDLLVISLFLYTGMRRGELLGLQIEDIDYGNKQIRIRGVTSKSKKSRTIPLHPKLTSLLKNYLQYRKEKGLTQEELVEQCNINVRTIQRIEAGEVNPRSYTIRRIMDVLNIDFLDENSSDKKLNFTWSLNENNKLNMSWMFGIALAISIVFTIIIEFLLISNSSSRLLIPLKIINSIIYLVSLFFFLRGFKLLAIKFSNSLLKFAVYLNICISFLIVIVSYFDFNMGAINTFTMNIWLLLLVFLGIVELLMGIGIFSLRVNLGDLSKVVGLLKIINGVLLITVLLSVFALFLVVPILIVEIIFIYNIRSKFELIHDDMVHS